jgi:hypothetical protein
MPSQGYATEVGWDSLGTLDWATYPPLWSDDTPLVENISFAMSMGLPSSANNFKYTEDALFNQTLGVLSNSTQNFIVNESDFNMTMDMQSTPSLLWTEIEETSTEWTTIDYPN